MTEQKMLESMQRESGQLKLKQDQAMNNLMKRIQRDREE